MQSKYTLGIIKPGAVSRGNADSIIAQIEDAGFTIEKRENRKLTIDEAKTLYAVHQDRPFYESYCEYMSSGPVVVTKLVMPDAVAKFRDLIGATNPSEAADGTIRQKFGVSIEENAIHGSDSAENAAKEVNFFFG